MTKLEFIEKVESLSEEDFAYELIVLLASEFEYFELSEAIESFSNTLESRYYKANYYMGLYKEQLKMTKLYLKGEMYTNKETAEKMLNRQIENIEDTLKIGGNNDD